jgi:hypothetical protein
MCKLNLAKVLVFKNPDTNFCLQAPLCLVHAFLFKLCKEFIVNLILFRNLDGRASEVVKKQTVNSRITIIAMARQNIGTSK